MNSGHTDGAAAQLNRSVPASAFTTGTDVFVGPAAYAPETSSGRELLAHELTSVVQRSTGAMDGDSHVSSGMRTARFEASAERSRPDAEMRRRFCPPSSSGAPRW